MADPIEQVDLVAFEAVAPEAAHLSVGWTFLPTLVSAGQAKHLARLASGH